MKILIRRVRGRAKAPNWAAMAKEVERTMDARVKPALVKEFKKVVADWEHKPRFAARKYVNKGAIEVAVYPTGTNKKIWRYVSEGTKPHTIRPKHAKALRFQWGGPGSYKPRTTVGPPPTFGGPGAVSGGKRVAFKQVIHPGIEARNFERHIADQYRPKFRREIENALRRGARRA